MSDESLSFCPLCQGEDCAHRHFLPTAIIEGDAWVFDVPDAEVTDFALAWLEEFHQMYASAEQVQIEPAEVYVIGPPVQVGTITPRQDLLPRIITNPKEPAVPTLVLTPNSIAELEAANNFISRLAAGPAREEAEALVRRMHEHAEAAYGDDVPDQPVRR